MRPSERSTRLAILEHTRMSAGPLFGRKATTGAPQIVNSAPQTALVIENLVNHRVRRNHMPRMRQKADLPSKTCLYCARSFAWRKKWARDWDSVKYCSDRCRDAAARAARATQSTRL